MHFADLLLPAVVLVSCQLAILEKWTTRIALTGASRPSLPTGETNGSASNLALRFLAPAGRDIGRGCIGNQGRESVGREAPVRAEAADSS